MIKSPKIEIFYFDAGGGHRSSMNALKDVFLAQHPNWQIVPINLQKLLNPADPLHRITQSLGPPLQKILHSLGSELQIKPFEIQNLYNVALKRGATLAVRPMLPILQAAIRRNGSELEALLEDHWQRTERPDLVVSVVPNFNKIMFQALRKVHPSVPYVTVMTDMVDYPPHFWMENQDQILVCGTREATQQARATGYYKPTNVIGVTGMILKKSFYDPPQNPDLTRSALGLSDKLSTGIIMFGGNGSMISRTIIKKVEKADLDVQFIVMCGDNAKLYDSIKDKKNCFPVGFVNNVADYMRLADFFIGKPGPGSLSEALHMGCPVITACNRGTMPQERPNVDWLKAMGAGLVIKSFTKDIVAAVHTMTRDLTYFQENIRKNIAENRAVFETVTLLAGLAQPDQSPSAQIVTRQQEFGPKRPGTLRKKTRGLIKKL